MCGICGVIQVGGEPRQVVSEGVLNAMTDAMTHRGPNDRGTYSAPGVALGVRRLSIVDVEGGHQPFANESESVWAVQNGELYNHGDVRTRLSGQGHVFRSRCDTEVIPHLYEAVGADYAGELRGKFAIAVWDGDRRRAVVSRDRLGVKPLYYARSGNLVVFASEIKSLLASGLVDTSLDYEAIDAYLTLGFFPAPATPLAAVRKLPAGHRLIVDADGVRVEEYWAYPHPEEETPRLPTEEYRERLLDLLEESVRLRLMSDVPVGAMLSGGLDSSLVVALMARNMSEPVKTFSVGFAEDADGNELADARYVSNLFGTDHHELELSFSEQTVDLAELVWHLDEPLADLSSLGFLALSKLAAEHVTVALSGQGADELLGGYRKYKAAAIAGRWQRLPGVVRSPALALARKGPGVLGRPVRALEAADPVTRLLAMSGRIDGSLRDELVRGPLAALDGSAGRDAVLAHSEGLTRDPLAATLYLDAKLGLVDDMLHYFDRASMAYSLEVRVPFLDHELVEFCATIPTDLKVRRLTTKYLLREAAREILPARVVDKRKVGFFSSAIDGWFNAQIDGLVADYLLAPSPCYDEILDRRVVERIIASHRAGGRGHGRLLLAILMLEVWLATFLPRAVAAEADELPRAVAAG
jgi:asparagine synthase (glutamine-hydrolysing)